MAQSIIQLSNLKIDMQNLPNVSETLLAVLCARAGETLSKDPIIEDWYAVEIVKALQQVRKIKIPKKLNISIGLRTQAFDNYVKEFMDENPTGIVINLGCGLDTRYFRLDNGQVEWYDIDFIEVIDVRKKFFNDTSRYQMIGSSILDYSWMDQIKIKPSQPILIYAEGVFMYLTEDEVKDLVFHLIEAFPKAHLVFENCDKFWVDKIKSSKYLKLKFRVRFKWDKSVFFRWGVKDSTELTKWTSQLEFADENIYLAQKHKKWGWMGFLLKYPKLFRTMWIIHYKFR